MLFVGFYHRGNEKPIFYFPSAETVFFVKQVQGRKLGLRETHAQQ
jgi:hypothetical protein